jgi:hypothetical protein
VRINRDIIPSEKKKKKRKRKKGSKAGEYRMDIRILVFALKSLNAFELKEKTEWPDPVDAETCRRLKPKGEGEFPSMWVRTSFMLKIEIYPRNFLFFCSISVIEEGRNRPIHAQPNLLVNLFTVIQFPL